MKNRSIKGQSLFELIIALGISSLILLSLVSLSTTSVKNTTAAKENSAAVRYAQQAVEFIRNQRDAALTWSDFESARSSTSGSEYCFNTSPPTLASWSNTGSCGTSETITGTGFRRDVTLTTDSSNSNIVDVEIIVNWDTAEGLKEVRLETTLTNWKQ